MNYLVAAFVAGLVSAAMTDFRISNEVKSNKFDGYHCQPITKHKTLEDAKAQVERYQAMAKGLNDG